MGNETTMFLQSKSISGMKIDKMLLYNNVSQDDTLIISLHLTHILGIFHAHYLNCILIHLITKSENI